MVCIANLFLTDAKSSLGRVYVRVVIRDTCSMKTMNVFLKNKTKVYRRYYCNFFLQGKLSPKNVVIDRGLRPCVNFYYCRLSIEHLLVYCLRPCVNFYYCRYALIVVQEASSLRPCVNFYYCR